MRIPGTLLSALTLSVDNGLCIRLGRPDMDTTHSGSKVSITTGTWSSATARELDLALLPEQLGDPAGLDCMSEWKHACLGHARSYNLSQAPRDAAARAARVLRARPLDGQASEEAHPLEHLRAVLRRVASNAPCALTFVGDSLSADSHLAAVYGALALGFTRLSWCLEGEGEMGYWDADNKSLIQRCTEPPFNMGIHSDKYPKAKVLSAAQVKLAPHAGLSLHPECNSLSLNLLKYYPELGPPSLNVPVSALLDSSSYLILNAGARANDPTFYSTLLDWTVRPFLDSKRFDKLLWRESLPQHFPSNLGSGTYQDFNSTGGTECAPIADVGLANWRNAHFQHWLQTASPAGAESLRVVPAFRHFLDRHDLHLPSDCTHFLYSPFTWALVWEGLAAVLGC